MKQVTLYFPDTTKLAAFILSERIAGIVTNSLEGSLYGKLTDRQIATACTHYNAVLNSIHNEWSSSSN